MMDDLPTRKRRAADLALAVISGAGPVLLVLAVCIAYLAVGIR